MTIDLLYGLQGAVAAASDEDMTIEDELPEAGFPPMDNGRMPSPEELLEMLDGMTGISDEERESLRAELMRAINGEGEDRGFTSPEPFAFQALILFVMLTLITMIFVFFGYKLYNSLIERERKREEKRKLKQLKKRK